jgi:hypothetical protein
LKSKQYFCTSRQAQKSTIYGWALSNLHHLEDLRCDDNLIENISPLLENIGLTGEGIAIDFRNNPLSTDSCDVYIPQLESKGVNIEHSCN